MLLGLVTGQHLPLAVRAIACGSCRPLVTFPLAGKVPKLGRVSAIAEVGRGFRRGSCTNTDLGTTPPPSFATSLRSWRRYLPRKGGR